MTRLWVLVAGVLAGCASAPQLQPPDRIESFCGGTAPQGTVVAGILGSVADRIETTTAYPGEGTLRLDVTQNSGIIAHWKSQPLYMPFTAAALGVGGNYIDVTDVVIDNQLAGNQSRLLYVTVTTPQGPKNIVLRSLDTDNVCVEGQRL
ncbi:MAG TPA: hypothetical protein VGP41_08795 [Candidatus Lustribacter sp.]|jgi:hypothetical protein|nr:hypothetical protein [Candidatus Lustribacter sp.]